MKFVNLVPLFPLLLFSCKPQVDAVRSADKKHKETPVGTVWIKDSIYMDKCEVRNVDYLEYLQWTKEHDPQNYAKVCPDTMVWRQPGFYNEPFVHYYLTHPAYREFPVVGVSYDQAVGFCKWRTARIKEWSDASHRKENICKKNKFYYRLPTKEEWEYAASANTGKSYGFESLHGKDKLPCMNVKETWAFDYFDYSLVPVAHFKPNKFGIYNAIGNVAEMVATKGVCKGGSWINAIHSCVIADSIKYDQPTAWLGFRCVCIVRNN